MPSVKARDAIMAAIKGEVVPPQVAEIVAHFTVLQGGPRGIAKLLHDAYWDGRSTPATRQRILDMVLYAMRFANQQQGPPQDMGLASDEDLEREAQALILKMEDAKEHGRQEEKAADQGSARPAAGGG